MCSLAIIGAVARTILRVQKKQQKVIDDLLFLFGCTCLIAATILSVKEATSSYIMTNLITGFINGSSLDNTAAASLQTFEEPLDVIESEGYACSVLLWVAIFVVKFCYLRFFRLLIDRLEGFIVYWRVAMGITAITSVFNLCAPFIACPYFGPKVSKLPFHFPQILLRVKPDCKLFN